MPLFWQNNRIVWVKQWHCFEIETKFNLFERLFIHIDISIFYSFSWLGAINFRYLQTII
jgi:hypothetical protein